MVVHRTHESLSPWLAQTGDNATCAANLDGTDLAVCVGGDGTVLWAALAVAPTAVRSVPSTQGVGRTSLPALTARSNARVSQPTTRKTTIENIALAQRRRDIGASNRGPSNQFFTADTILVVVRSARVREPDGDVLTPGEC